MDGKARADASRMIGKKTGNMKQKTKEDLKAALAIIAALALLLLSGCKTVKYVPVEKVRTEYRTQTDTVRDSIQHEVYVNRYLKGDTQYVDRIEYLYRDRWKTHTDTVVKQDSIPVTVTVEREPTRMEKIQAATWWWMAIMLCVTGCALYFRIKRS